MKIISQFWLLLIVCFAWQQKRERVSHLRISFWVVPEVKVSDGASRDIHCFPANSNRHRPDLCGGIGGDLLRGLSRKAVFSVSGLYPRTPAFLPLNQSSLQKHLTLKTKRRGRGDSVSSPHLWPKFSTTSAMLELGILHNNDHFTLGWLRNVSYCWSNAFLNVICCESKVLIYFSSVEQSFLFLSQVPAVMSSRSVNNAGL